MLQPSVDGLVSDSEHHHTLLKSVSVHPYALQGFLSLPEDECQKERQEENLHSDKHFNCL